MAGKRKYVKRQKKAEVKQETTSTIKQENISPLTTPIHSEVQTKIDQIKAICLRVEEKLQQDIDKICTSIDEDLLCAQAQLQPEIAQMTLREFVAQGEDFNSLPMVTSSLTNILQRFQTPQFENTNLNMLPASNLNQPQNVVVQTDGTSVQNVSESDTQQQSLNFDQPQQQQQQQQQLQVQNSHDSEQKTTQVLELVQEGNIRINKENRENVEISIERDGIKGIGVKNDVNNKDCSMQVKVVSERGSLVGMFEVNENISISQMSTIVNEFQENMEIRNKKKI
eukprot:TRINITY_DN62672_c0_g1_i1.p2 TRINITY_DN62672_c0_g1~~TRINITY_DN62672_c0_g1_i1.p2  ORF type:complete len:282 (-),score=38.02 TRINITY_DN62672_c0_g1_i1:251-1096(-)